MRRNVTNKTDKTTGPRSPKDLAPQGHPVPAPDKISPESTKKFAPDDAGPPTYCQVPVEFSRQEDGLWRAEAPHLTGCWVDAPTVQEALCQIQEVIAMVLDLYQKRGWVIPRQVTSTDALPLRTTIPLALQETTFRRVPQRPSRRKPDK